MSAVPDLPLPESLALEHSTRLVDRIRDEIERHDGWMSFERFMEMALYEPGLGYYSAGSRKLGPAGDFVTAPEISPLFSRCLARQCREVLTALGGGDILELGAGSGIMAADVLAEDEDARVVRERVAHAHHDRLQEGRALLVRRRAGIECR